MGAALHLQPSVPCSQPSTACSPLHTSTTLARSTNMSSAMTPSPLRSSIYTNYLKEYAESPVAADSLGWKKIPETINGRAAMLGEWRERGSGLQDNLLNSWR